MKYNYFIEEKKFIKKMYEFIDRKIIVKISEDNYIEGILQKIIINAYYTRYPACILKNGQTSQHLFYIDLPLKVISENNIIWKLEDEFVNNIEKIKNIHDIEYKKLKYYKKEDYFFERLKLFLENDIKVILRNNAIKEGKVLSILKNNFYSTVIFKLNDTHEVMEFSFIEFPLKIYTLNGYLIWSLEHEINKDLINDYIVKKNYILKWRDKSELIIKEVQEEWGSTEQEEPYYDFYSKEYVEYTYLEIKTEKIFYLNKNFYNKEPVPRRTVESFVNNEVIINFSKNDEVVNQKNLVWFSHYNAPYIVINSKNMSIVWSFDRAFRKLKEENKFLFELFTKECY